MCGLGEPSKQIRPLQTACVCWRPEPAAWHTTLVWRLNGALFYWLKDSVRSLLSFLLNKKYFQLVMGMLTDSVLEVSLDINLNRRTKKGKHLSGIKEGVRVVPSMVPHLVFLPSSLLPLTWYSWSLPTTAKGIISCSQVKDKKSVGSEMIKIKYIKNDSERIRDVSGLWKGMSEHKWG